MLLRLRTVFLSNNRINRIATDLEKALPNLTTLVLSNNLLTELADLLPLASVKSLRSLSLIDNHVSRVANYRLYVVHFMPFLTLLDFRKIKQKVCQILFHFFFFFLKIFYFAPSSQEREEAKKLFSGKKGKELEQSLSKSTKGVQNEEEIQQARAVHQQTVNEDVERIKVWNLSLISGFMVAQIFSVMGMMVMVIRRPSGVRDPSTRLPIWKIC